MSIEIFSFQYIFRDSNDEEPNEDGKFGENWVLVFADGPDGKSYDSAVFQSREAAKRAAHPEMALLWGVQQANVMILYTDEEQTRQIFTIAEE
jgi:hypothetical protein